MDNCTLNKIKRKDLGLPGKVISYASICNEVRKNTLSKEDSKGHDLPFFSDLIGKVSHQGVIHSHWAFLRY